MEGHRPVLGTDDPLIMAELLRQAFEWIGKQEQADYDARKAREKAANAATSEPRCRRVMPRRRRRTISMS